MPDERMLGIDAKIYRNTGPWVTPVWVELLKVKDVTVNQDSKESQVLSRGDTDELTLIAAKSRGVDFDMSRNNADTGFQAIRDAYINKTAIELLIIDGDVATSGNEGLRANFLVTKRTRSEPLEGEVVYSQTIKPTVSANDPVWFIVV